MFSRSVEYALRAMVALAARYNDPMTVKEISEATQVPRPYLSKMMNNLARAELVRSRRGLGGGFALARPPNETTLLDIINTVDPMKRTRACLLEDERAAARCPLHRRLDEALEAVDHVLHGTTLAQIVGEEGGDVRLCVTQLIHQRRRGREE